MFLNCLSNGKHSASNCRIYQTYGKRHFFFQNGSTILMFHLFVRFFFSSALFLYQCICSQFEVILDTQQIKEVKKKNVQTVNKDYNWRAKKKLLIICCLDVETEIFMNIVDCHIPFWIQKRKKLRFSWCFFLVAKWNAKPLAFSLDFITIATVNVKKNENSIHFRWPFVDRNGHIP